MQRGIVWGGFVQGDYVLIHADNYVGIAKTHSPIFLGWGLNGGFI